MYESDDNGDPEYESKECNPEPACSAIAKVIIVINVMLVTDGNDLAKLPERVNR